MQVKLLLFTFIWITHCMQFLLENHLNGCQFWTVRFSKTESEPNFGFPHMPTNQLATSAIPSITMQYMHCEWYCWSYLETRFARELAALGVAEVVIRVERRIQRGYQVEQSLGWDGVAQNTGLTAGALSVHPAITSTTVKSLEYNLQTCV